MQLEWLFQIILISVLERLSLCLLNKRHIRSALVF